ncbi:MAG TPA: RsmE family RNA methyltransferase [Thermoanaerobaculia bacterium]
MSITMLVDPARWEGAEVEVTGGAYRHLFRARRLAAGDRLRVVDGRGRARWGEIAAVERARARVRLGEAAPAHEPAVRLDLLVPTLRPERAAWLVEKATEVGVAAIHFLHTERAPRSFGAGTLQRLGRVAAAAVEQCGRSLCPEVTGVHGWEEIAALTAGVPRRFVLDTEAGDALSPASPAAGGGDRAALLVGPEGGFTAEERIRLTESGWISLSLGSRTLRTETAAVVGAAIALGMGGRLAE